MVYLHNYVGFLYLLIKKLTWELISLGEIIITQNNNMIHACVSIYLCGLRIFLIASLHVYL